MSDGGGRRSIRGERGMGASAGRYKASQTMREDLDNWRDQNGRAISPRGMKIWGCNTLSVLWKSEWPENRFSGGGGRGNRGIK